MKYLLDTQTFLWAATGAPELPVEVRRKLEAHRELLGVPAMAVVELAMKDRLGRKEPKRKGALQFPVPFGQWIHEAFNPARYVLVSVTAEVAVEAFNLPGDFHRDPFDMLIVATAKVFRLELVTSDKDIHAFGKGGHAKVWHFTPNRQI